MSPARILFGQIIVVFAITLLCLWAGTEWTAAALGYQAQLGAPWTILSGHPVYRPWQLFPWWYFYGAYAPNIFARGGMIAASGGVLGAGAAMLMSLWRARVPQNVTTYGSARWSRSRDLRRAGLFARDGAVLGQWLHAGLSGTSARYLRHKGPEHLAVCAPTRTGKGVGIVVPTLLTWPKSVLVHDLKGELWQITAGWRATMSNCLAFVPTDPASARYNPMMEVRRGLNEVKDVQNIADILVDPQGSLEKRSHWELTAHSLLVGVILHVLYAEAEKTLARVAILLADPARSIEGLLDAMLSTNHVGTEDAPQAHPVVASVARELLNKSSNERSGVVSTAMTFLSLFRDPVVASVTSASDFRISDLVGGKYPMSLYLITPPSDISRTKPLMRLILNQIVRRLSEELDPERATRGRHRLLMMLDEFPQLGRLEFFETSMAFLSGYKVRCCLICQSLNQLARIYGPNHAILDNCHVRIAFASNDTDTQKKLSESLGTATEQRAMRNYAGHRLAIWLGNVMVSRQETPRPLLTPGEVRELPDTDQLILMPGTPPIRASKLRYYADRNFTERQAAPPKGFRRVIGQLGKAAASVTCWTDRVRGIDARLAAKVAASADELQTSADDTDGHRLAHDHHGDHHHGNTPDNAEGNMFSPPDADSGTASAPDTNDTPSAAQQQFGIDDGHLGSKGGPL